MRSDGGALTPALSRGERGQGPEIVLVEEPGGVDPAGLRYVMGWLMGAVVEGMKAEVFEAECEGGGIGVPPARGNTEGSGR